MTFQPKDLPTGQLHACLLAGIAPRPIAFVSTVDAAGQVNLSPYSFFNIFGSNPATLIFSPARRVRDNTTKHTLQNIQETMVCTVNIVDYPMVEQMSLASTEYEKGVNEFVKAGLTQLPSELIDAPRVGESPLAMECRVQQIIETGDEGGAGNLVIAEVINVHLREDACGENGLLDVDKLDLVGRMGGSYYVRASGEALFEIPKPLRTRGIGVDSLPQHARNSTVLTGNDLGRLGNQETVPKEETLAVLRADKDTATLLANKTDLHKEVKRLLAEGENEKALALLFL
ncbi:flavin reductase [Lewinellaceae bacterium SD302]|nr:flavin reductase [Lewinellaceae bacterium SD302]